MLIVVLSDINQYYYLFNIVIYSVIKLFYYYEFRFYQLCYT